eukprot:1163149-Alexandrium_andersonii.AAC.1
MSPRERRGQAARACRGLAPCQTRKPKGRPPAPGGASGGASPSCRGPCADGAGAPRQRHLRAQSSSSSAWSTPAPREPCCA